VALALAAAGLVVAGEIVVTGVRHRPWLVPHDRWYQAARAHPWSAAPVQWVCLALAAAGTMLLVATLARRGPAALPLGREPGTGPAQVDRASLEGALARTVEGVDGIDRASVRVGPEGTKVAARTTHRDLGDLRARVGTAVAQHLADLDLTPAGPDERGAAMHCVDVDVRRQERRRKGRLLTVPTVLALRSRSGSGPAGRVGDRIVLGLLGLALLGAGAYGLARGFGAFGDRRAGSVVLNDQLGAIAHHQATIGHRVIQWFWPAVALAALGVAYLAYRWLRSLLPPSRRGQVLHLTGSGKPGAPTTVRCRGLEAAVADDLAGYRAVTGAEARLTVDQPGSAGEPVHLDLWVDVDDGTDVAALRRQVHDHAVGRLRHSLGRGEVPSTLHLRLRPPTSRHLA